MKAIHLLLATATLVAMPALFTSCDDDPWDDGWHDGWYDGYNWHDENYNSDDNNNDEENWNDYLVEEAGALTGEWDGSMVYTYGNTGQKDSFSANMTFVRNSSTAIKGTGTEIDYATDANGKVTDSQTLKFDWSIDEKTGNINIKYLTDKGTTFVMDASASVKGFSLSRNSDGSGTFSGYMSGSNTSDEIYIDLKIVQNTNAKAFTRATAGKNLTFGADTTKPVFTGVKAGLNNRR